MGLPQAYADYTAMVASFGKAASGDAIAIPTAVLHDSRLTLYTARLFMHFKELGSKKMELREAVLATLVDMKQAGIALDDLHAVVKAKCTDAKLLRF